MKRFKNVLVVYDDAVGGDDALSQAVALCVKNNAHLTIATVLQHGHPPGFESESEKRTRRLVAAVRQSGVNEASGTVLRGVPYLKIIRQVVQADHDLVIVSEEAGKTLRNVLFGGVAAHLTRKGPCPVWVIRPGQAVPYRKILAAVGPSPTPQSDDLNIKILDLAISLASRDQAALHIVHAWDVEGKDLETIKSETSARQHAAILERHRNRRRTLVDELLTRYPMGEIDHELHLPRSLPEPAIVSLAADEQIDLIVMGTEGRYGVSGFVLGNAVEAVLRSVNCGMLAVKPDRFETPVELPETVMPENRNSRSSDGAARHVA